MEKKTKVQYFNEIKDIITNFYEGEEKEDYIAFVDKQINSLENQRIKQIEKREKNKEAADELTETIYSMLDEVEYRSIELIISMIGDEELTKNKVVSRMSRLIKEERAEKTIVKNGTKRQTLYRKTKIDTEDTEDIVES